MRVEDFVVKITKENPKVQGIVCMEELAELIHAISKWERGNVESENLAEEIADVTLCLRELQEIFGIGNFEIESRIQAKIDRFYGDKPCG